MAWQGRTSTRRRLFALAAVGGMCAALAPAAHATSAAHAIVLLNQQRAANGIPGTLAEDASMDNACQSELAYGSSHGNAMDPSISSAQGQPGVIGSWIGVTNLQPWQWAATINPWSWLPEDTYLMDPHTQLVGYADESASADWTAGDIWACIDTGRRALGGPTRFYSVPGDGTSAVPTQATMWSGDFGIPQGSTTGPAVAYWIAGDQEGTDRSVSMSGPSGPVALATAQSSGVAVPRAPLQAHSVYTVTVTWQLQTPNDQKPSDASGPAVTQHFSFTTGVAGDAAQQAFGQATAPVLHHAKRKKRHRTRVHRAKAHRHPRASRKR